MKLCASIVLHGVTWKLTLGVQSCHTLSIMHALSCQGEATRPNTCTPAVLHSVMVAPDLGGRGRPRASLALLLLFVFSKGQQLAVLVLLLGRLGSSGLGCVSPAQKARITLGALWSASSPPSGQACREQYKSLQAPGSFGICCICLPSS